MSNDILTVDGRPVFYDREGRPISATRFGELRRDLLYRLVARDKVGKHVVATMWLGFDHSDGPDAPPLIFGTVLRDLSVSEIDIEVEWLAATETQALENQAKLIAILNEGAHRGGDSDV